MCRVAGTAVRYVKPHGALYNAIVHHEAQAAAVVAAVRDYSTRAAGARACPAPRSCGRRRRRGCGRCGSSSSTAATRPRARSCRVGEPGALLHDPDEVTARVLRLVDRRRGDRGRRQRRRRRGRVGVRARRLARRGRDGAGGARRARAGRRRAAGVRDEGAAVRRRRRCSSRSTGSPRCSRWPRRCGPRGRPGCSTWCPPPGPCWSRSRPAPISPRCAEPSSTLPVDPSRRAGGRDRRDRGDLRRAGPRRGRAAHRARRGRASSRRTPAPRGGSRSAGSPRASPT